MVPTGGTGLTVPPTFTVCPAGEPLMDGSVVMLAAMHGPAPVALTLTPAVTYW